MPNPSSLISQEIIRSEMLNLRSRIFDALSKTIGSSITDYAKVVKENRRITPEQLAHFIDDGIRYHYFQPSASKVALIGIDMGVVAEILEKPNRESIETLLPKLMINEDAVCTVEQLDAYFEGDELTTAQYNEIGMGTIVGIRELKYPGTSEITNIFLIAV